MNVNDIWEEDDGIEDFDPSSQSQQENINIEETPQDVVKNRGLRNIDPISDRMSRWDRYKI